MKAKATSRIIADVRPEVKEKLQEMANDSGRSMTEILSYLIESEFKRVIKN
jgi:hypothetical protein